MSGTTRELLVQPPPHVTAPELLLRPFFHYQSDGDSVRTGDRSSVPYLELLRQEYRTPTSVVAWWPEVELAVGSGVYARMARTTLVCADSWRVLGTRPLLGRFFADEEAHPATGARVVVLGRALWQRLFGRDPTAVDSTLQVKGQPYLIVGVAPRGFRGVVLADTDVWLPLFAYDDDLGRPASWHTHAGSSILKFIIWPERPATIGAVAADLSRALRLMIERENQGRPPERPGQLPSSVTLTDFTGALGSNGRRIPEGPVAIWVAGVAGVLLLVAGANVTSLLLRALRRRPEMRLVLGDGIRIGVVAIATGRVLALIAGRWAAEVLFDTLAREPAILLTVAAGLLAIATLASLAPARRAARINPMEALRLE